MKKLFIRIAIVAGIFFFIKLIGLTAIAIICSVLGVLIYELIITTQEED